MSFTRDDLVQRHVGLVHDLARRMHSSLADDADLDELTSAGMLDELRRIDPLTRTGRERERLREALQSVDRDALEVLVLSFYEDRTLREIAPRLGFTESGASRIRSRAIRQLRQRLSSHARARTPELARRCLARQFLLGESRRSAKIA